MRPEGVLISRGVFLIIKLNLNDTQLPRMYWCLMIGDIDKECALAFDMM
jgi:hypothetical protein